MKKPLKTSTRASRLQPMRFIGSKANLLSEIDEFVTSNVNDAETFGDFFCGSAIVSAHFKKQGYKIIANDNLAFCATLAKAVLYNDDAPPFTKLIEDGELALTVSGTLTNQPYDLTQSYLNNLKPVKGFVYRHYSPEGTNKNKHKRLYFSNENAQKIDAIRIKIEEWNNRKLLDEAEYSLLIADLIRATNKVANIAGTYGFFMKDMSDPRVKKRLLLERTEFIRGKRTGHRVYCMDANELAKNEYCDVLYIDPPYNWRHYGAYYHLLETISRWDNPRVKGKSGLRKWSDTRSRYCYRKEALPAIIELVKQAKSKNIFISYNSEGLITHEQMSANLSKLGNLKVREIDYQRYKSNNGGSGSSKTIERIYYVKK